MIQQSLVIEEGVPQDAKAVLSLVTAAAKETDFITGVETILEATPQELSDFLSRSRTSFIDFCLLARLDEKVVGLLNLSGEVLSQGQVEADVFMLVAKTYRGYGIGQLLLEIALDWAEENPYIESLKLDVQVRNTKAIYLYKKYGFRIESMRKNDIKSKNGEDLDVYHMRKSVSQ
ncbi:TPA: GNAT family N-acetyltransferase [Streptococcus pyogenes]|uniref:GNAT family N-acetyltransferase n=1 Tax=Streptococcus pyogenes TaxID=1314 RepID=UPI00050C9DEA|nr:N-acetyltransferase [Streptococcus pyogenes]HER4571145.1 GNAT family N-acetyltransferase [Streptococcus pyogenes NGAS641]HER4600126.1 GNAT family N-acetyltransferase [Streptococcus pyogenes NGAS625]HER4628715.1 GNAT family N-acetyltransferase [Streptococcus pyogenes NGAS599]HER4699831.1 GNAT family N-acetyltransferase [Streptococcus pyogenes NGAS322]AKZ49941.1 acetyltransferase [Streptococcus pyogenes]